MVIPLNAGPDGKHRRQAAPSGGSAGSATIPPETCDMFCSQVHKMVRLAHASARSVRCRLPQPMTDPSTPAP